MNWNTLSNGPGSASDDGNNMYRVLAEEFPYGIYISDLDGNLVYINRYMADIHDFTLEELSGAKTDLFYTQEHWKTIRDLNQGLLDGGSFQEEEVLHKRKGGSTFPMLMSAVLIPDKEGKPAFFAVTATDFTHQKRTEEELHRHRAHLEESIREQTAALRITNGRLQREIIARKTAEGQIRKLNETLEKRVQDRTAALEKAYKELKELDRMKDAFVSSVSHELRTPLTSIVSYSEFLLDFDGDAATKKEFLQVIHTECGRLSRLVEDVFTISRLEAGGDMWKQELIPIPDLFRDVMVQHEKSAADKSIRFHQDFPDDLPPLIADRRQIHRLVANLIDNAIKFSPEETEVSIKVGRIDGRHTGDPNDWIMVSIADNGYGIDEEYLEKIFDRFSQSSADHLTDKPDGTGLGLSICRMIVSHYRGTIWAESGKDGGSTFSFTLPCLPDPSPDNR